MTAPLQHLLAASALITTLERIVGSGVLQESQEQDCRLVIVLACRTFEIPTIAERSCGVVALAVHHPIERRT